MSKKEEETGIHKPGSPRKDPTDRKESFSNCHSCGETECKWHNQIDDD